MTTQVAEVLYRCYTILQDYLVNKLPELVMEYATPLKCNGELKLERKLIFTDCRRLIEFIHIDAFALVIASPSNIYKKIGIYDISTTTLIRTLDSKDKAAGFISDIVRTKNLLLATGYADGKILIWDPATGVCIHQLCEHQDSITCLGISNNGDMWSASYDSMIKSWDMDQYVFKNTYWAKSRFELMEVMGNGKIVVVYANNSGVASVISPDDSNDLCDAPCNACIAYDDIYNDVYDDVAHTCGEDTIKTIKLAKSIDLINQCLSLNGPILSLAQIDYKTVATANISGVINIWDVENMISLRKIMQPFEHTYWDIKIAVFDDGSLLSSENVGTINIWDPNSGALKRTISHRASSFDTITVSSKNQLIITYAIGILNIYA